jgi:adenylyltransferase/sulfurtransferase
MGSFGIISAAEVKAKRDAGEQFRLIDVREPREHRVANIAGAELRPLGEIQNWASELPDRNEQIILYCHHGMRSERAASFLARIGFTNVSNLVGGIDEWSQRVDPSVPRY